MARKVLEIQDGARASRVVHKCDSIRTPSGCSRTISANGRPPDRLAMEISSPLHERSRKPFETISDAWKHWIGRHKLFKASNDSLINDLTHNGQSRDLSVAEVQESGSDSHLLAGAQGQQRLNKALSLLNAF